MRTIIVESESRRLTSMDLTDVAVPSIPGLFVTYAEVGATRQQLSENLPKVPGVLLLLKNQDRSDSSKLRVLIEDILRIEPTHSIATGFLAAVRSLPVLAEYR